MDVGGVFALGPFGAFDGDLGEGAGGSRVDRGGGGRGGGRRAVGRAEGAVKRLVGSEGRRDRQSDGLG